MAPAFASLLDEAQSHAFRHRGGAVAYVQLLVDVPEVRLRSAGAQHQSFCDARPGEPFRGELQDLSLTGGQGPDRRIGVLILDDAQLVLGPARGREGEEV